MLTTKPTYTASAEDERERSCFLLTNSQPRFAHGLTHDSSCDCAHSLPQRSAGVGKTNMPASWQGMKEAPQLYPWSHLKGDLLQMSPFCKNCPWRSGKDKESYRPFPKAQRIVEKYICGENRTSSLRVFKYNLATPCEEEMLRHSEVSAKVPALVIFTLHCSHNHLLNKHKLQPHIRLVQ